MKNTVPEFIADRLLKGIFQGKITAYTMFIDISGFTSMTQKLMEHGKEGAEILSGIINDIFTPSIDIIYDNGGFVSSFAGDAFTSIFHRRKPEYALNSAFKIIRLFAGQGLVSTKFGNYRLEAKIGLSHGKVKYGIINSDFQKACYFSGEAIDSCAEAEHKAQRMQIIADCSFEKKTMAGIIKKQVGKGWYQLFEKDLKLAGPKPQKWHPVSADIERQFIPNAVLELRDRGEFREILACFVGFADNRNYKQAIQHIIKICNLYGGYFNRIDFGDKGAVLLILFGAPLAREKLSRAAADFILSLKDIPGFKFRAGLSKGIAFAGFVGSKRRQEYTALGSAVNLSARLMTSADWMQVLADKSIVHDLKNYCEIELTGHRFLKGFKKRTEVYSINSRNQIRFQLAYSGKFISRAKETEILSGFISPVFRSSFGGIIHVDGPAGIGKSHFISDFIERTENCAFFYLPCDEILRKPFNPFIYFLKTLFRQSEYDTKDKNKSNFRKEYARIINSTADPETRNELIRTESFTGALLGLKIKDSLYIRSDPKIRYENTIYAVKSLIKSLSFRKPLVLIIDDGHWIDTDSLELIRVMIRNVDNCPFAIIVLCRPSDSGERFSLFEDDMTEYCRNRVEIRELTREMTIDLIQDKFPKLKIPRKTIDFIYNRSNGNPFFIEQIVLYLNENRMLNREYEIIRGSSSVPSGINQIIIARIDRLSAALKETVKTASVLGREFSLPVLRQIIFILEILKDETDLFQKIEDGSREQIWENISSLKYIFLHAMIRDAAYEIQLKERLRQLHDLAGKAIEAIYNDDLYNHSEELAEHYEKAENSAKARFYLENAGDKARDNYQNIKALSFYDRLLKYLETEKDSEKIIEIMLNMGDILNLINRLNDAGKTYKKALELSEKIKNQALTVDCRNSMGNILRILGKIKEAESMFEESLQSAVNIDYKNGMAASLRNIGIIHFFRRNYEKAMECYAKDIAINRETGNQRGISIAMGNIGLIYKDQGNYKKAMEHYRYSLEICNTIGDKRGAGIAYGNIGNIYAYLCEYEKAMENYQQKMAICSEIGDKKELNLTIGNMGNIYFYQGKYSLAMQYYKRYLSLSIEIGDKRSCTYVYGNIANLYRCQGKLDLAMEYLEKKIELCKKLDDQKELGMAIGSMGIVYTSMGKYKKAMECCRKWADISEKLGDKRGLGNAFGNIGKIFHSMGNYPEAMENYKKMLSISEELGDKRGISLILGNLGFLYNDSGDHENAIESFRRKLRYCEKINDSIGVNETTGQIGIMHLKNNNLTEARDFLDRAISDARGLSAKPHLMIFLYYRAVLHHKTGNIVKADEMNSEALKMSHDLGNNDINILAGILKYKMEKNTAALIDLLNKKDIEEKYSALIYFELWEITQHNTYKENAKALYRELYRKIPKSEFRMMLKKMGEQIE